MVRIRSAGPGWRIMNYSGFDFYPGKFIVAWEIQLHLVDYEEIKKGVL